MKKALIVMIMLSVLAVGAFGQDAETPLPAPAPPSTVNPSPCVLTALRLLSPRMITSLSARLSLTDDQKAKVSAVLAKAEQDSQPKVLAQKQAAQEFVTLLVKPDAGKADLVAAGDKAMKAESALLTDKVNTLISLRAVLTDQQNKDLSSLLDRFSSPWKPAAAVAEPPAPPDNTETKHPEPVKPEDTGAK